jgi:hypothetical protein
VSRKAATFGQDVTESGAASSADNGMACSVVARACAAHALRLFTESSAEVGPRNVGQAAAEQHVFVACAAVPKAAQSCLPACNEQAVRHRHF